MSGSAGEPDMSAALQVLARSLENSNFSFEPSAKLIALCLKVKARLKIEPESIACSEVSGETKRSVGSDGAGAVNYLVDSTRRHADILCKPVL